MLSANLPPRTSGQMQPLLLCRLHQSMGTSTSPSPRKKTPVLSARADFPKSTRFQRVPFTPTTPAASCTSFPTQRPLEDHFPKPVLNESFRGIVCECSRQQPFLQQRRRYQLTKFPHRFRSIAGPLLIYIALFHSEPK